MPKTDIPALDYSKRRFSYRRLLRLDGLGRDSEVGANHITKPSDPAINSG